jgi:hypothetical protein
MRETAVLALCLLALTGSGCRGESPSSATATGLEPVPGWEPAGAEETYDRETIFHLVNGQADAFFAYGFEEVSVQDYENAEGAALSVEIWQLATPADAYGLFTTSITGAPADIGTDGDAEPGRRLAFWQDRYFVYVRSREEVDDADLWRFAKATSAVLPSGGERPALVDRLPVDGLVERSAIFFHEEISIQDQLWLGGENLLGLGPETDGVLARYVLDGAGARLLLVEYADSGSRGHEAASAGLAALREAQGIDSPTAAATRGNLLGAVFGEVDEVAAQGLLEQELE